MEEGTGQPWCQRGGVVEKETDDAEQTAVSDASQPATSAADNGSPACSSVHTGSSGERDGCVTSESIHTANENIYHPRHAMSPVS